MRAILERQTRQAVQSLINKGRVTFMERPDNFPHE